MIDLRLVGRLISGSITSGADEPFFVELSQSKIDQLATAN